MIGADGHEPRPDGVIVALETGAGRAAVVEHDFVEREALFYGAPPAYPTKKPFRRYSPGTITVG
jgi:hypothetical protein